MASLESLSNPLERLTVLPTAVNIRKSGAGDITWDAGVQYFQNDLVISTLDGGAYVFTGGASNRTSILGGSDPAAAPTLWTSLATVGIQNTSQITVPSTLGAANAITLPAGATLTGLPAGSTWLVAVQGSLTTAIATVAADVSTFTFTPNGAGAVTWRTDIAPIANTVSTITDFGQSGFVTVGTGGSTITPTAAYAGAAPTLVGLISYVRIA